jgi:hypothetical protein
MRSGIFSCIIALTSTQTPTEMNASNLSGGKARKADKLTAICEPIVCKMSVPRRVSTLWASRARCKDNFNFHLILSWGFFVSRHYSIGWLDNLKYPGKKLAWFNRNPTIFLEGLRKTMNNLSQYSWWPSRDLNRTSKNTKNISRQPYSVASYCQTVLWLNARQAN